MNRLPAASTATSVGKLRRAAVAGPPSPVKRRVPVPATVSIIPLGVTFRIRWLYVSAMNRFPVASTATLDGTRRRAAVAGPPSPLKPPLQGKLYSVSEEKPTRQSPAADRRPSCGFFQIV